MELKVIHVLEEARFGGPQKRVLEVAKKLNSRGIINNIVITSKINSKIYTEYLDESDIKYYTIPLHRVTKEIRHLFLFILLFPLETLNMMRIFLIEKPNIIHVNGVLQFRSVLAARLLRIKCVWHLNDTYMPRIVCRMFKYFAKCFTINFLASSIRTIDFYKKFLNTKREIPVIYPPVNLEVFNSDNAIYLNDVPASKFNIVIVSNINPIKDYLTFVKMVKVLNLINGKSNLKFYVIGKFLENQKTYTNRILDFCSVNNLDNIIFLGPKSNVQDYLKSCDLFVCTSKSESGPMVVFEALAMGLPIVSTDVGDLNYIFSKYNAGRLVGVGDYKHMANEISKLISDNKQYNQLKSNSIKTTEVFSLDNCVLNYESYYLSL